MSRLSLPAHLPRPRARGRHSLHLLRGASLLAALALSGCLNLEPLPPIDVREGVDTVTDALAADATADDDSITSTDATPEDDGASVIGL